MNLEGFKKVVMERKSHDGSRYKMSYTVKEREFAMGFALDKKSAGYFMSRISKELGVSQSTLIKWIKPKKKTSGMLNETATRWLFECNIL